ncbi:MAG: hypothetical protein MUO50_10990 [Longimicrobiales bacterium]|nr:hypothetical protein [Longimicrobiales bacterium]
MLTTQVTRGRTVLTLALTGLVLSGCSKAPAAEIEAADAAIAATMAAGAEEYAPASWGSVNDLRAQLDAELAIQSEKFALTRSYDHAQDLAMQVKAASEEAASETAMKREEVRQQTATLLAEVKLALVEVQGMLTTAPRGKGSAADLAALKADLDTAAAALAEGETAMGEERYMDAQAKVLAAQSGVEAVKSAIQMAIGVRGISQGSES